MPPWYMARMQQYYQIFSGYKDKTDKALKASTHVRAFPRGVISGCLMKYEILFYYT